MKTNEKEIRVALYRDHILKRSFRTDLYDNKDCLTVYDVESDGQKSGEGEGKIPEDTKEH